MKRAVTVLLTLVAVLGIWSFVEGTGRSTAADKDEEKKPVRKLAKFMRAKLASSNLVLEGLCIEDFDMIEKGAIQMQVISAAEEWRVSEDPLYAYHSEQFRGVAKQLKKQANEKNLEGAALSYLEMTMSCIQCHRFVRAVLLADQKLPGVDRELLSNLQKLQAK